MTAARHSRLSKRSISAVVWAIARVEVQIDDEPSRSRPARPPGGARQRARPRVRGVYQWNRKGLCASGQGAEDEGDGLLGLLAVRA